MIPFWVSGSSWGIYELNQRSVPQSPVKFFGGAESPIFAELRKCKFLKKKLDFLGYWISGVGLKMDFRKVWDVVAWETPKIRCQLQNFLGFANFYWGFLSNFVKIALPLTDLFKTKRKWPEGTKPSSQLDWTP